MINLNNLKKRVLSALILLPFVFFCVFYGGFLFNFLTIVALVILCSELNEMTKSSELDFKLRLIINIIYLGIPCLSLIYLRSLENGLEVIIYILFLVWATDIAAFFGGNYLKGPKLMPNVSPNKTISGAISGLLGATLIGFVSYIFIDGIKIVNFLVMSVILSIFAQAGDLFESKLKRVYGVKDSSNLIPGHGGLLDRLDSLLFVAPISLLCFEVL
jgi:phosphatidate cytidylyltransferase